MTPEGPVLLVEDLPVGKGCVVLLTLNRPHKRNAIDRDLMLALDTAVDELAVREGLVAVVLRGAGDQAFCAGGDLRWMQSLASPEAAEEMGQRVRDLLHRLSDLPVPVVAVLNGYALGGGTEIALACDLCVIEEHAVFQFKQVRMGLLTGWGGGGRLVHRLGYARALELVATARALGSEEALALGIAQKRAPSGQGLDAALEWARAFERGSGRSIAAFKRLFRFASTRDPRAVGEEEQRLLADLFLSPDHQEALAAFFEKRSPEFGR